MLKFSDGKGNAKLRKLSNAIGRRVFSFSLLSGYSCPFASECYAKAVESPDGTRHILDGPVARFRCFSASQEVLYTTVWKQRKHNWDEILECRNDTGKMVDKLLASFPQKAEAIRIHVAGDFFNRNYFRAWAEVAKQKPNILFYAYTKALKFWADDKVELDKLDNFILTASYGGTLDKLIPKHNLRSAIVVNYGHEAAILGLELDFDDSHAADPTNRNKNFALLIHGVQQAGTAESKAVQVQRKVVRS